ncbi:hypothetical protein [Gynuella sp.]|uniref:hypothetical protein n=1 Tax=Gynuella sp. TaxID=2969146 RepID=UPI003D147793
MSITILQATQEIDDLLPLLDRAYWEANSIDHKDTIHNVIWLLTQEAIELHKVSIQDGHYRYEPVTETIRHALPQMRYLAENLSEVCRRTNTHKALSPALHSAITIFD